MPSSRQHQEAHGIGQIEEQLAKQADAAASIQGNSSIDQETVAAANRENTELDEIIDPR